MEKDIYCVIMAGGVGSRFWPLSTPDTPKQFLDILGIGKSLLQQTYDRFRPICKPGNFLVVTSPVYKNLVLEQIPELKAEQVLAEPLRRNTAPCIAYANAIIKKKNPHATIVVTPSDHLIMNEEMFRMNIRNGLEFVADKNALLTLGIKPSHPETGYGYIQIGETVNKERQISKVKTFTEKPNLEMATILFESGEFYWNSGIFIWSLESIQKAFASELEEVARPFDDFFDKLGTPAEASALEEAYLESKNISIDYGIMEKASNVYVNTVNFGWSDLGTWSSLYDHSKTNKDDNAIIKGDVLTYDTKNCIVHLSAGKKGVIQGLENYIIVESENALLICPRANEEQIRQFHTDINTEFITKP